MKILVLEGDGIGPDIVAATVEVVKAADRRFNLDLELEVADNGLSSLEKNGSTLPEETWGKILAADGVILGPCHTAIYPAPEQGGINPSARLRTGLDLYANIRPSKIRPGVPAHVTERTMLSGNWIDK